VMMAELYAGKQYLDSTIQAIRIGGLTLVGLPGEIFTETVLALKAMGTNRTVAVVGYANDYCGYFPDRKAVKANTYEALVSPFSAKVAEVLVSQVATLIEDL
jgi:hypothetical protein